MKKNKIKRIPTHVAFIMDGNGRWAKRRMMPRSYGHKKAVDTVTEVVEACFEKGIRYVSLFAFSTENWNRPKEEVDALFSLLRQYFQTGIKRLLKNGVRLRVMGDLSRLPADVREDIESAIKSTEEFSEYVLNIGINYGGRDEIVRAVNRALSQNAKEVTEEGFSALLDTAGMPDPDLIVRSSGEKRVSNFMMHQMAYAELYFPKTLWPDFGKKHVERCIRVYNKRKRRFGGLKND
ncbi:MAG: di-trans,poly-cis-decaprenylcistransferase [Clostridia bacterium]|nr:di-trans,poly-cis-decaprenylcistransferase [Clostridia bacterium]